MNPILHVTTRMQWERGLTTGSYATESLDSVGFIYCSEPRQVLGIANSLYRGREGLVLLCIDPERVTAQIKYESQESGVAYPHIYGPLNADAVVRVHPLEPQADGTFTLPEPLL